MNSPGADLTLDSQPGGAQSADVRPGGRPLVLHAGLYATSAALLKLVGFGVFLWLARSLSVTDYATWGLLYALQSGVAVFGLVGIIEAAIGLLKEHREPDARTRLFAAANTVFVVTATSSMVIASAGFLVFVKSTGATFSTILAVVISGGLLAFSSLQAHIVRLQEKHAASLAFNFAIPLAGILAGAAAFALGRTESSFFTGSLVGLAVAFVIGRLAGFGFYSLTPSVREWRPVAARIAPFILVAALGWLSGYGNNYIIEAFFRPEEVAKFTLAFMLSSVMPLIAAAMNQVWSPRFYRLIHEEPPERVEAQSRRVFRLQSLALGLAGGLLLSAYPLLIKFLGSNLTYYRSISAELLFLLLAYVILTPYWHCQNYLLAFDRGSTVFKLHVLTSAIGIGVLVLLMWVLGSVGIYVGFLTQMILRSIGAWVVARRSWPISISLDGLLGGAALACAGYLVSVGISNQIW